MKVKLGEDKVHQFRRSWDLRPDPLDKQNPYHPSNIEIYKNIFRIFHEILCVKFFIN